MMPNERKSGKITTDARVKAGGNDPQIRALWRKRCADFWREMNIYLRDVVRSGFPGFVLLFAIVASIGYGQILKGITSDFPQAWITVPVLTVALASGRPRTFLKDADTMFLLPAEYRTSGYFQAGFRYSLFINAGLAMAATIVVWPLYAHVKGSEAVPFGWLAIMILLLKWSNLLASWHESRMTAKPARIVYTSVRWGLNGIVMAALFHYGMLPGAIAALLAVIVTGGIIAAAPKHRIAWSYLIELEKRQLARHYRFYSWFTDVPHLPAQAKNRTWLMKPLTRIVPMKQQHTYLFLFTATFVRGELFGIVGRLSAVAALIVAAMPGTGAKAVAFGIALAITGVQLTALAEYHRHVFWLKLYPASEAQRIPAAAGIAGAALLVQAAVLAAVWACSPGGPAWPAALAVAGGVAWAAAFRALLARRLRRKQQRAS
ncbi:ABC transporter permease [Paenibacillus sp. MBLB4367]|uniref:ABC transporter permease n=1 Tax=Paenibacillus sp. MBLB4367 TaxID=3384767 RepID=UPI003907FD1E